jgi:hypothetical protein
MFAEPFGFGADEGTRTLKNSPSEDEMSTKVCITSALMVPTAGLEPASDLQLPLAPFVAERGTWALFSQDHLCFLP